ncbi:hypothetical protein [Billgrantia lactosivorans]|uniref:hypothetical protein n=1 Tax=Billgrantia lactosivorans TaxID=2185141 RepID=UPI000DAD078F|nr:hypothetical protein [Halomonas lactosivorans]
MRQETFTEAGIDVELTLLRDSSSRHWLVIARWHDKQGTLSTHTLPPLAPDLAEEQAWREARSWAIKRLTKEMLEAGGVKPKFAVPI